MFESEKVARKIWQAGDRVRIRNGGQYDGRTGTVYCVPPAKHPQWLYTVVMDQPGEHDCDHCQHDEMEPLDESRRQQLVEAGIGSQTTSRGW